MLPDFIIIGAMKSGTTSLFNYIASHPEIVPSSIKEPAFFIESMNFKRGLDWYASLFNQQGQYAFEASTSYTKRHIFPGVPTKMHAVLPDIKLIYLMRDPLERAISHYVHNYANGRESQSFSRALRNTNRNYIRTSQYYYQAQAYLDCYPRERILFVKSESLQNNPVDTMERIFDFLGISPEYDLALLQRRFHKSNSKKRRSTLEWKVLQRFSNKYLRFLICRVAEPFRESFERPALTPSDRGLLVAEISPDVKKLRNLTALDLSDWSV